MKASVDGRRLHRPCHHDIFRRDRLAVQIHVVVDIGPHHAARQVDSGKQSLRARVRQDLGLSSARRSPRARRGRPGRRRPTLRRRATPCCAASSPCPWLFITSSTRSIDCAPICRPQLPFADLHEDRRAPFAVVTAAHQALAVLAADDERRLLEAGHHDDARGALPEILRDVLVGHAMNLSQHRGGLLHPVGFLGRQVRRLCRDRQPEHDRRNS